MRTSCTTFGWSVRPFVRLSRRQEKSGSLESFCQQYLHNNIAITNTHILTINSHILVPSQLLLGYKRLFARMAIWPYLMTLSPGRRCSLKLKKKCHINNYGSWKKVSHKQFLGGAKRYVQLWRWHLPDCLSWVECGGKQTFLKGRLKLSGILGWYKWIISYLRAALLQIHC